MEVLAFALALVALLEAALLAWALSRLSRSGARAREMEGMASRLGSEAAVARGEADGLRARLEEERSGRQEALDRQTGEFRERERQAEERHRREMGEREEMLSRQFSERLELLGAQLRTVTDEILRNRSEELDRANRNQMDGIISPLKEEIRNLKKSMDDSRESFSRNTGALEGELGKLLLRTESLGQEAEKLSRALQSGPKVQGDFGEMKLYDLLERFGMTRGVEYDVQYVIRDASGRVVRGEEGGQSMRPDAVLHYPDHREIVIDAKASLTAFIAYVNAETDEQRKEFLAEHVRSVRNHIKELAAKRYGSYSIDGNATLEFVVMFVPQEAALQLAIQADPGLWGYAFENDIVITGEQNMYTLLRLLQIAWNQRRQEESLERVFAQASLLVGRVGLFEERMRALDASLARARKSYDDIQTSVYGKQGLVLAANKLISMGAREDPKKPVTRLPGPGGEVAGPAGEEEP